MSQLTDLVNRSLNPLLDLYNNPLAIGDCVVYADGAYKGIKSLDVGKIVKMSKKRLFVCRFADIHDPDATATQYVIDHPNYTYEEALEEIMQPDQIRPEACVKITEAQAMEIVLK